MTNETTRTTGTQDSARRQAKGTTGSRRIRPRAGETVGRAVPPGDQGTRTRSTRDNLHLLTCIRKRNPFRRQHHRRSPHRPPRRNTGRFPGMLVRAPCGMRGSARSPQASVDRSSRRFQVRPAVRPLGRRGLSRDGRTRRRPRKGEWFPAADRIVPVPFSGRFSNTTGEPLGTASQPSPQNLQTPSRPTRENPATTPAEDTIENHTTPSDRPRTHHAHGTEEQ